MATTKIVDANGQPFTIVDIEEPQTSRLAHLQTEIARHPTRGLTPSRLAQILDAAENNDLIAQYELFEDMEEKSGHIASEMGKRRRALQLDWEVVPPDNPSAEEKRTAEIIAELLAEIPDFEQDVIFDATDAIGKGFACLEIEWHKPGKWWVPKTITHRPQTWFQLHRGYRQELRLRDNTTDERGAMGAPLQPFGWITHIHKAKSGYLERSPLFRQLAWSFLFGNYSVGDLAEFLAMYGKPIRIGKYPSSASEKDKLTLLRALASIGHNAAGIIPEGMLLDFLDAVTGDPDAFELMISWSERTQSKVILGGTLTSGADGKSSTNALGNVHNEVRKDLRDGDIRQMQATLSRDLLYPMAALNGLAPGGLKRSSVFRLNTQEREDLATFATALPGLVAIGVRPPVQWAHERLGIPQAKKDEPVLMPAAAPTPVQLPPGQAALTAITYPVATTPPELMAGQLARTAAPAVGAWVDAIRQLVERAQSLEEIRDGLLQLYPGMTLDQHAQAMAQAMSAAYLAGRYEVLQEAGRA